MPNSRVMIQVQPCTSRFHYFLTMLNRRPPSVHFGFAYKILQNDLRKAFEIESQIFYKDRKKH